MLSGATLSAAEMAGTAVFRIVVSSDSIKNATATSQGSRRLLDAEGGAEALAGASARLMELMVSTTYFCCRLWAIRNWLFIPMAAMQSNRYAEEAVGNSHPYVEI